MISLGRIYNIKNVSIRIFRIGIIITYYMYFYLFREKKYNGFLKCFGKIYVNNFSIKKKKY